MKAQRMSGGSRVLALSLIALCVTTLRLNAQWPQFRGPDGMGTAPGALPLTWDESTNVRWKTPIHGRGWSSPIVLGHQIWMSTASEDGRELFGVAVDRDSGKVLHDLKLFEVAKPQYADPFNSYASPTPVAEPGRVYITFGSPGTAAVDANTGKVLWERRDLECNHFRGAGSSPILFRDLIIMHFDGSDVQYLVALDKNTGTTVWRTPRSIDYQDLGTDGKPKADGDFRKAFATPHIVTAAGEPLLVSLGSMAAYGYDPLTGKELWKIEERSNYSSSTRPVSGHGLVFYPTGWSTGQLLAVKPDGRGDVTATHVVWRVTQAVPKKPSLLLAGDLLFMINDVGVATCLEAKTGTQVWKARLTGEYSASPILAGNRIYFFNEDGKTTVIEAGREFKVLGESLLDNGFMASPAVADGALFLRTRTDLYRIQQAAK
jgi:outer membrane protein assembly factor BamB